MNFTVIGSENRLARDCASDGLGTAFRVSFCTALEVGGDKLDLATCELGLLVANII